MEDLNKTNSSIFNSLNYTNYRDFDFDFNSYNRTNNISLKLMDHGGDADIGVGINSTKSGCDTDKLSTREMLIIFAFVIVVLIFIIYNITDFFELKGDDCRCLCCKKKQEERVYEMDRTFADMIEMSAFDDDGNFIFGKKHVGTQTSHINNQINMGSTKGHEI